MARANKLKPTVMSNDVIDRVNAEAMIFQDKDLIFSVVYHLSTAGKSARMELIKAKEDDYETFTAAAIEIQRLYRGFRTRCRLLNVMGVELSIEAQYGGSRPGLDRLKDMGEKKKKEKKDEFNDLEVKYLMHIREHIQMHETPEEILKQLLEDQAEPRFIKYATDILKRRQSRLPSILLQEKNGIKSSKGIRIKPYPVFCAAEIGTWYKKVQDQRRLHRDKNRKKRLTPREAAITIQNAWRRHIDTQVFRYYRDLINFKQKGDPSTMLKCINPNEAKLLDAASGIHVKFRLAGDKFPPNIYYKIFTHRPIQDLCANAPRDYTKAEVKRKEMKQLHQKGFQKQVSDKHDGWYERIENNGWRLVSDRLLYNALTDPVTWQTSRKKVDFSHISIQRKVDVERKKKQKKIDWMKKLYHDGMLHSRVKDSHTRHLIEGATRGMVTTIEQEGIDAVQSWEVDELLEWTTSLNFDDYWKCWKEIATTGKSESLIEQRFSLKVSLLDPFELTLMEDPDGNGTQKKSQNTPRSALTTASIGPRQNTAT